MGLGVLFLFYTRNDLDVNSESGGVAFLSG